MKNKLAFVAIGIIIFVLGMIIDARYKPFVSDNLITVTIEREVSAQDEILYKITMIGGAEDKNRFATGDTLSINKHEDESINKAGYWPALPPAVESSAKNLLSKRFNKEYIIKNSQK